jgi:hypothetical protein
VGRRGYACFGQLAGQRRNHAGDDVPVGADLVEPHVVLARFHRALRAQNPTPLCVRLRVSHGFVVEVDADGGSWRRPAGEAGRAVLVEIGGLEAEALPRIGCRLQHGGRRLGCREDCHRNLGLAMIGDDQQH